MMRVFFITVLFFLGFRLSAQDNQDPRKYMPTDNVEMGKDYNKRANRPNRKRYSFIYVPNADKILYGNPCALEATHRMGFEYLVEPRSIEGSKTKTGKILTNLWTKSKLVVTRTPFWKAILKKRFRECRIKSGDLVG